MFIPILLSLLGLVLGVPDALAASKASAATPATAAPTPVVNLNTADAATLARDLVGIGPAKAKAIVDYRTKNGPFRSVDDLALVKGIGQRIIDLNRPRLRVTAAVPIKPR